MREAPTDGLASAPADCWRVDGATPAVGGIQDAAVAARREISGNPSLGCRRFVPYEGCETGYRQVSLDLRMNWQILLTPAAYRPGLRIGYSTRSLAANQALARFVLCPSDSLQAYIVSTILDENQPA